MDYTPKQFKKQKPQRDNSIDSMNDSQNEFMASNSANGIPFSQTDANISSSQNTLFKHAFFTTIAPENIKPRSFLDATKEFDETENMLHQIPPNFELCKKHIKAKMMKKIDLQNIKEEIKYCHCCAEISDAPLLTMCDSPIEMAFYGFGVTLYFSLLKMSTKLASILLFPVLVFVYVIYTQGGSLSSVFVKKPSLSGDNGSDSDKIGGYESEADWSIELTIGNVYKDELCVFLGSLTIILVLLYYIMWLKALKGLLAEDVVLDCENLTPSDYTIQVNGLPKDPSFNEQEFLAHICTLLPPPLKPPTEIFTRSVFSFDISPFELQLKQLNKLKKLKFIIDNHRKEYISAQKRKNLTVTNSYVQNMYPRSYCCKPRMSYDTLVLKINQLENNMATYEKKNITSLERGNIAYLTFKTSMDSDTIIEKYRERNWKNILKRSWKFKGHPITISRAPEPEDIQWVNLTYSRFEKFKRSLTTWFASVILLFICFFINLTITLYGRSLREDMADDDYLVINSLRLCAAIIIIIINTLLGNFIPEFTRLERHSTATDFQISTTFKLTLAMFINSVLIPLTINWPEEELFSKGGLINTVYLNWIVIVVLRPILELFNPLYLWYLINRSILFRRGEKSCLTQIEANKEVEPPQINIPKKYAEILLILLYTAFYLPLFPLGIIITVFGLPINYWVCKYLMLRRYCRSDRISSNLPIYCFKFLNIFLFLLMGSSYIWEMRFGRFPDNHFWGLIPVLFFPSIWIIKSSLRRSKRSGSMGVCVKCLYERLLTEGENKIDFKNIFGHIPYDISIFGRRDYMAFNPLTRNLAFIEVIAAQLKEEGIEEEEKVRLITEDSRYRTELLSTVVNYILDDLQFDKANKKFSKVGPRGLAIRPPEFHAFQNTLPDNQTYREPIAFSATSSFKWYNGNFNSSKKEITMKLLKKYGSSRSQYKRDPVVSIKGQNSIYSSLESIEEASNVKDFISMNETIKDKEGCAESAQSVLTFPALKSHNIKSKFANSIINTMDHNLDDDDDVEGT